MQIGSSYSPVATPHSTAKKVTPSTASDPVMKLAPSESDTTETTLMKFLKMSPAEKMQYTWLTAHKLTKEKLADMSPDERAAIQKQMETEIQQQASQDTENKRSQDGNTINMLV